jgi:hypothetical protein
MPVSQEVFKFERIVPIEAKRAVDDEAEPDDIHPDVDDRGYVAPEFGPVVSVTKGKTVVVRLERFKLDSSAPLTAVSSDTNIFTLDDPKDGKLPLRRKMDIKITGVDGGDDRKEAKLRVQFGDKDQALTIFELNVWVFKPLDVDVTPHRITIDGSGAKGTAPVADIPKIMEKVKAIWGHYGVNIVVHDTIDRTVTMAALNGVNEDPFDGTGEVNKLLKVDHQKNTINAYFVQQILSSDPNFITLGLGISVKTAKAQGMKFPGIILADGPASVARNYVMYWANDLAHEIGHFFTLEHSENAQRPAEREDSWSRRMLMHVFNEMRDTTPFPDPPANSKFRPRFTTSGYDLGQSSGRRGCMVTLKHLKQLKFDAEVITARKTINGKPEDLYGKD